MHGPQSTRRRKQTNRLKALIEVRESPGSGSALPSAEPYIMKLRRGIRDGEPAGERRGRASECLPRYAAVATAANHRYLVPRARVRPAGPIGKSLYRKMGELGLRGACRTDSRPPLALAGCTAHRQTHSPRRWSAVQTRPAGQAPRHTGNNPLHGNGSNVVLVVVVVVEVVGTRVVVVVVVVVVASVVVVGGLVVVVVEVVANVVVVVTRVVVVVVVVVVASVVVVGGLVVVVVEV